MTPGELRDLERILEDLRHVRDARRVDLLEELYRLVDLADVLRRMRSHEEDQP